MDRLRIRLIASDADGLESYGDLIARIRETGADIRLYGPRAAHGVLPEDVLPFRRGAPAPLAASAAMLVSRFDREPPHLVHAVDTPAALAGLRAASHRGVPGLIATATSALPQAPGPALLAKPLGGLVRRLARRVVPDRARLVAHDRETGAEWAEALGRRPSSVTVLEHGLGVDIGGLSEAAAAARKRRRAALAAEGSRVVVAVAARTASSAEAARAVVEGVAAAGGTLHVIAITRAGDVPWAGAVVAPGDAPEALALADVLLSLDVSGSDAYELMGAAALGIPAVAWGTRASRTAIRSGVSGVIVGSLGDATAALRAYVADGALRDAHGARGRLDAARLFDRDLATRRLLTLYDEVLGGPAPEPLYLEPSGALIGRSERRARDLLQG